MKKVISVLLVFAVLAALLSTGAFAADIGVAGDKFSGFFSSITDFFAEAVEQYNSASNDFIFDAGVNDFLGEIDALMESICVGIINLVATIENLFA